jgi:hypothetical protein
LLQKVRTTKSDYLATLLVFLLKLNLEEINLKVAL